MTYPTPPGPTPEQLAAVNEAQTPQAYMAAATAAGLVGQASDLAASGAAPVAAPTFEAQLAAARQDNAALQAQLQTLNQQFQQALAGLQGQVNTALASIPQKVDPVTESAGKVVQAFASVAASDAKNILHSTLVAHLEALGLSELKKLL